MYHCCKHCNLLFLPLLFSFLVFSWEAYEKGTEAHLQADPTKLEILAMAYDRKKEDYKTNVKESILDRYGGKYML